MYVHSTVKNVLLQSIDAFLTLEGLHLSAVRIPALITPYKPTLLKTNLRFTMLRILVPYALRIETGALQPPQSP